MAQQGQDDDFNMENDEGGISMDETTSQGGQQVPRNDSWRPAGDPGGDVPSIKQDAGSATSPLDAGSSLENPDGDDADNLEYLDEDGELEDEDNNDPARAGGSW